MDKPVIETFGEFQERLIRELCGSMGLPTEVVIMKGAALGASQTILSEVGYLHFDKTAMFKRYDETDEQFKTRIKERYGI